MTLFYFPPKNAFRRVFLTVLLHSLLSNSIHFYLFASEEMPKAKKSSRSLNNFLLRFDSSLELKRFSYFACKSKIQASRVQGNCSVLIQTLLQSQGWGRMGISECHILLNFHSALPALRYTGDCSYRQFQVNSIFYLVSSGQHAHIFWWLVVIYLLVIINMEELSDWHMSNRNLSYVSVEKTNYMALQIKLCFLNSSAFLDQT